MQVVVIGAGIAGLTTAYGLRAAGADVRVLERRRERAAHGSGLSLMPNGLAALDALGLDAAVADLTGGHGPAGGGTRRPDGTWLGRVGRDVVGALRVVHRAELHARLVDTLAPGTVRFGADARLVEPRTGRVRVDGAELCADLVVGADGVGSATRSALRLDPGLRWAGYGAWRGVTTGPVPDVEPAETWGRGRRFGVVPLPDGRVYWFGVEPRRDAPAGDPRSRVLDAFGHWHDPIARVVAATPEAGISWTDIHDLVRPLPTYTRGRVVLAGDAAHAMTPNLGQGANQALEDAATLVGLLTPIAAGAPEPLDLRSRLARYDAVRRRRSQAVAAASRRVGAIAQASDPVLVAVRDALARAVPPALAARQMRDLARWSPPGWPGSPGGRVGDRDGVRPSPHHRATGTTAQVDDAERAVGRSGAGGRNPGGPQRPSGSSSPSTRWMRRTM